MSSTKELKERMGGVRETKQITGAMYLVASTKLRHAREALEHTRPYFDALRREIARVFQSDADGEMGHYFSDGSGNSSGVCGILAITGDKGLAGAYNMNVIRKVEALLKENPGAKLFVIGEYGRRYFLSHYPQMEQDFIYSAQNPNMDDARDICRMLLERYDHGELSEILVIYTDMQSSLSSTALEHRLLPLERKSLQEEAKAVGQERGIPNYEFFPSKASVLYHVLWSYLSGFIYSAAVDSLCSEQNARVTAMDAAGRNAEELLSSLSLQLNRERQAAITQEITEISAGAQAQRRRQKEDTAAWQTQA